MSATVARLLPASDTTTEPSTVPGWLLRHAATRPRGVAMRVKELGRWREITWEGHAARVASVGRALAHHGIGPSDRVLLVSENRPEWVVTDLAVQGLGAATIGVFPTTPTAEMGGCCAEVAPASRSPRTRSSWTSCSRSVATPNSNGSSSSIRGACAASSLPQRASRSWRTLGASTRSHCDRAIPISGVERSSARARRDRDRRVHAGHHRCAQGRDAHAPEPRGCGSSRGEPVSPRRERPDRVVPPAV